MESTRTDLIRAWWEKKFEQALPSHPNASRFDLIERLKEQRVAVLVIDVQDRLMRRVDPDIPVIDQEKTGHDYFYRQIEKTTAALRKASALIVHVGCGMQKGPDAWQVLPARRVADHLQSSDLRFSYEVEDRDYGYLKFHESAFHPPSRAEAFNKDLLLENFLKAQKRDTLLKLGLHGDSCIKFSALDARHAFDLGFISDLIQNNRFNRASAELCRIGLVEGGYSRLGPVFRSKDIIDGLECQRPLNVVNGSHNLLLQAKR